VTFVFLVQTIALKLVAQDRLASLMMSVTTRGNPISLPLPLCLCRFIVGKVVDRDISKHSKKMLEQCFDADALSKVVIPASDGVSEQTCGQLLLKEWTENHDEYFTSRDLETSAAQVGSISDGILPRTRVSHLAIAFSLVMLQVGVL
jgi:hypothetical protein